MNLRYPAKTVAAVCKDLLIADGQTVSDEICALAIGESVESAAGVFAEMRRRRGDPNSTRLLDRCLDTLQLACGEPARLGAYVDLLMHGGDEVDRAVAEALLEWHEAIDAGAYPDKRLQAVKVLCEKRRYDLARKAARGESW